MYLCVGFHESWPRLLYIIFWIFLHRSRSVARHGAALCEADLVTGCLMYLSVASASYE